MEEINVPQRTVGEFPQELRQGTSCAQTEEKTDFPPLSKSITVTAQVHRSLSSSGDIISSLTDDSQDILHMNTRARQQQQTTMQTTRTPDSVAQRIRQRNSGADVVISEIVVSRPLDNEERHRAEMENGYILSTGLMLEKSQESPREQRKARRHNACRSLVTPEIVGSRASVIEETPQSATDNGLILTTGSTPLEIEGTDRPGSRSQSQQMDDWNWSHSETSSKGRSPWSRPTRHE